MVMGPDEREKFRAFMRMYENFSGCRVLSYCLMSNHFHILLEVPPMPGGGLSEAEFRRRLGALYKPERVRGIVREIEAFREAGHDAAAAEAVARYTRRMHDLSEFMKGLLIRFTRWFNRTHNRKGTLWEERFKSVIVESGAAARTMAAYIDLNPVRAGMVSDPADYRWSSYGEATGGGARGYGKKAREGLVRAFRSAEGVGFEAGYWPEVSREYRSWMSMALERKPGRFKDTKDVNERSATEEAKVRASERKETEATSEKPGAGREDRPALEGELPMARMLARRVRYFSDGAVIGGREFVDEVFRASRERFGPKRKSGARKMRGAGAAAAGRLWSMRDLRTEIG
jgi:REP element-mobilizing transposase RayT